MTNASFYKEPADDGLHPGNDAPSLHLVRRVLVAVRRGWDDTVYLNRRLLERPW
jgi:hypothetical protein